VSTIQVSMEADMLRDIESAKASRAQVEQGMQQVRSNTINRMNAGVDINQEAFAPYSEKGPWYQKVGGGTDKRKKTNAKAFLRRIGVKQNLEIYVTAGGSIRWPSYAAYKAYKGQSTPNLLESGQLQQAVVVAVQETPDGFEATIGVYGEPAIRGQGHNEGVETSKLPQRKFFGFNDQDDATLERYLP
jgi:phage gpG-like protein